MKDKLLSLLREKPRTLEELSKLVGQSTLSIKFHLIGLPIEEKGGVIHLKDDFHHRFTWARQKTKAPNRKKRHNKRDHGLQHKVYNNDHGWLTKPLTIEDFTLLDSLSYRVIKIIKLLHSGLTQAQIARKLKITRQAVHKHVKKLLKLGFIKKFGSLHGFNKTRDVIYQVRRAVIAYLNINSKNKTTCQPQNKGDVSSPKKPFFTLHRLQLAFHIVNQSKPPARSASFVKTYNPRGWTGYIYLIGNVRIRVLPHKVIAELTDELEFDEELTAEDAVIRAIDNLKAAIDRWLEEQAFHGVEFELSHPYLLNPPEFAFRSKLVKKYIERLRRERRSMTLMQDMAITEPKLPEGIWIDDSPKENGKDAEAHIETDDPSIATELDIALRNAYDLPNFIKPIQEDIKQVKALIESGIPIQQQMYQLMGIIGQLLKEVSHLREELARLKGSQN